MIGTSDIAVDKGRVDRAAGVGIDVAAVVALLECDVDKAVAALVGIARRGEARKLDFLDVLWREGVDLVHRRRAAVDEDIRRAAVNRQRLVDGVDSQPRQGQLLK